MFRAREENIYNKPHAGEGQVRVALKLMVKVFMLKEFCYQVRFSYLVIIVITRHPRISVNIPHYSNHNANLKSKSSIQIFDFQWGGGGGEKHPYSNMKSKLSMRRFHFWGGRAVVIRLSGPVGYVCHFMKQEILLILI